MKDLIVRNILDVTGGELIIGDENLICKSFSRDTRKINKGDVYFGIKGETFNGNDFWKQALENGASCVIIENVNVTQEEKEEFKGKTIIKVKNTLEALYNIARYKRSLYNIPVIGITGSVGKTSTKDIIANVVAQKYKTLKTLGNNNNNIGLPFTILRLQMGMNHFGEISLLTSIAKPTICIITNIGTSHIGNLGSKENILKAKLEILEGCESPTVIINNDDELLHKWYESNKGKVNIKTYGIQQKSDLNAENIVLNEASSNFTCKLEKEKKNIHVPIGGEHFVLNSLCAVMVGEELQIDPRKIANGISSFELTKKRMDITEVENGIKIINDAYNASLESMSASLKFLSEFKEGRKIAILGDMLELGDFAKEIHEKVGEEIVKRNIDILICSGENAKYIAREAKEKMNSKDIYYLEKKEDIITLLEKIVKPKDIILVKASNGMRFYELAERMISLWRRKS